MAEIVLETHALTMRFGGVTAADNVNFRLRARELRCLIGPNGAGKSTFFKCVTGLQTPTEGQVFMRGHDTTHWMPHQIASLGVGIKMQTPSVMDNLSVFENIWLAARRFYPPDEAGRKTAKMIERLALGPISRNALGQLAHGERQRVELGLVAVVDPWLVLLDEPAAGMSAQEAAELADLIRRIAGEMGCGVLLIEHNVGLVLELCDHIVVLDSGAVIETGDPAAIRASEKVRHAYMGTAADTDLPVMEVDT